MKIVKLLLLISSTILMSSCLYKMPSDETYRVHPVTNNPAVTKDPGGINVMGEY